jgi:hypothetical protein
VEYEIDKAYDPDDPKPDEFCCIHYGLISIGVSKSDDGLYLFNRVTKEAGKLTLGSDGSFEIEMLP